MDKKSIGIGLMGLGVIGGQVARVLLERGESLAEQVGYPVILRKIKVLEQDLSRPQAQKIEPCLLTTNEDDFFNTPGIDIVIELIGGERPALNYHKRALLAGKHVITANKEVIAKHGAELAAIAQKQNVSLSYEAAVGGGIPLIMPFKRDLVANEIKGIYAIINGTTNYILTRMSREGIDFALALKQAQQFGYAEADPKNDIEGIDSKYKLAILASLAFKSRICLDDIYCEGVSRLSNRDFRYAKEMGYVIKLLAIAKQSDNSIEVRVHPACLPEDDFLAKVDGVYNAILVEGDLVGKVTFLGEGAGPLPTSSAVVADVVRVARDIVLGAGCRPVYSLQSDKEIKKMSEIVTRYFIRMNIADSAGVLAQIARILGDNNISIASAIQKEADEATKTAEIVIMTHPSQEKGFLRAVDELNKLEMVKEINNFIRVEA
ncbi:MAG: homoserine dehydrogenase [Chloroflexota bacterium]